jgi:hypothetical protein
VELLLGAGPSLGITERLLAAVEAFVSGEDVLQVVPALRMQLLSPHLKSLSRRRPRSPERYSRRKPVSADDKPTPKVTIDSFVGSIIVE